MGKDAPARRTRMSFRGRRPGDPEDGLSSPLRLRPLAWAVVYVLATTFSFAPTLTFRSAAAKPGSIATRDVVAPRDLIVPDPAATERRRAETADEVLPVYDWDTAASARLEKEFSEAFGRAREASAGTRGRRVVSPAVREAFGLPIGEEALAALARLSFSRDLEDRLIAAAADLYRTRVVDNRDLLLENQARGVQLRDTASGQEVRRRELSDVLEYGSQAKTALLARLAGSPLKGRELSEVASFLAAALRPNLTLNAAETVHRREEAARSVETVLTKIPRGKVIVRKGDEISPRVAEWIAAARASVADLSSWVKVAGIAILETLAAAAFWLDSRRQRRRMRERSSRVVYGSVLASGILFSLVTRGAFALAQGLSSSFESSAWATHAYYAIPFAAGSIMVSLVAGMGPALLFAAVHSIGAGVLMGQSFSFVLFAIVGSLAGIFGLGKLRARSVLLAMGGIVAGANLVSISAITFLGGGAGGSGFAGDALAGLLGGWFVAMIIGVFLPLFENLFHVATDIRMLELSNQNLPLLRTLALEAPGTYQHSLMVGHLSEAATEAIGADALLARVAGYYHDIGKTKMPDYFIENQPKGFNRHDRLEPSMSALVIAAHVKEGVEMAKKARLPEPLVAAIREHHGTKLIRYFYQKALTRSDAAQGAVSDTEYRHTGPKPATRVNAILMIADAVEAASRTLIEPTPAKIRAMIQTIVDDCLRDGQFDNCDLTMRDLAVIVDTLERSVATVFHHRIDYPGFEFNRERGRRRAAEGVTEVSAARSAGPRAL
ncbi:MAG: HD family phosphohydrolase [Thermoanaerobaculia bacterium]